MAGERESYKTMQGALKSATQQNCVVFVVAAFLKWTVGNTAWIVVY
jgi:hypothetical protein